MGYNTKMNLIISMTISGAIAGILGNLIYCGFSCEMQTSTIVKVIPQEGFDGIAVGLISMNNPLAVIPVSLFFSIIKTSTSALQLIGISSNITLIFLGIIIYCSAMGSLLMKFNFYN
jgi:simple sugar transport system permease protein